MKPAKDAIRNAVFKVLKVGVENGLNKYQIAKITGYDAQQVYNSGIYRIKNEQLEDAEGNQLVFCREQIAGTKEHRYFFATSVEEARKYGWYRDKYNKTAAKTTWHIKDAAFSEWKIERDGVSLAIAELQKEMGRVAFLMARPDRPEQAEDFEVFVLPYFGLLTTQVKVYADRMESVG